MNTEHYNTGIFFKLLLMYQMLSYFTTIFIYDKVQVRDISLFQTFTNVSNVKLFYYYFHI